MTNNKTKDPLFHISKRIDLPPKIVFILYIFAIIFALAIGGVFITTLGQNPFVFYYKVFEGCFRSEIAVKGLLRITIPLLITSIGVSYAFKMKFWNIGGEGQFIMGAVFASYVGLFFNNLPHWLLISLMFVAGALGGGLFGLLTALLKCHFNTNETLLTLMLNYIALYIVQYLRDGPWRDPAAGGFPKIKNFVPEARVDQLFGIDVSWVIAIILVILTFIYFNYTKQGYEISVVGDSKNTARYAGMNVNLIVVRTMVISAAICGIAGMLQVAGEATSYTLTTGIASGIGFTAIIVAWLGKLHPVGIVAVSFLFAILEKGSDAALSQYNFSSSVSSILQGIILFIILGFDFFITYKIVFKKGGNKNEHNN